MTSGLVEKGRVCCFVLAVVLAATLLSACAGVRPPTPSIQARAQEGAGDSRQGWWYASFRMNWPEGEEPSWYMDLLLAHGIVYPVLSVYENEIALWRFHRRAARDQSGHRFSFIFFASPDAARRIYAAIQASPRLKQLRSAGIVIDETYDDTQKITRPEIEGTSDKNWSVPVQRSWPYFIMGVSQMWLGLIASHAESDPRFAKAASVGEMQALYRGVSQSIEGVWQDEGSHAFLHHLNAIFGYRPVAVTEKRLLRF